MTSLMIAGKRSSWLNRLVIASVAAKVRNVLFRQIADEKAVERKEWENIVYQLEPTYFLGDF